MTTTNGKAENPIATKTDVNGIRVGSFIADTKCPTVQDIRKVEFLDVKNRTKTIKITSITSPSAHGTGGSISMRLIRNGVTIGQQNNITSEHVGVYNPSTGTNYVMTNIYCENINHNYVTQLSYSNNWPSNGADSKCHALWEKTINGLPVGKQITLKINTTIKASQTDYQNNVGSSMPITFQSVTWYVGYIITDLDDNIIWSKTPYYATTEQTITDLTFYPTSSDVKIYCIVVSVSGTFYTYDNADYYIGFRLAVADELQYNDSYYDSVYKLAQYQDIYHVSNSQFTIYFGIWNNKSSNAKLDKVEVKIKKSWETSWTTIGTKSIGTVNSTLTGSVNCTLPANFDPSVAYELCVTCGQTTYNQSWHSGWGNSSSITSGQTWTLYSSSAKTGSTGAVDLNSISNNSVLSNFYNSGSANRNGRTTTRAALFRIT